MQINGNTYSAKLLELLQSICSEIDTVGKILSCIYDSSFHPTKYTSFKRWWLILKNNNNQIQQEPIAFRKETLFPWKDVYAKGKSNGNCINTSIPKEHIPIWWDSYNNVKHRRTDSDENGCLYYTRANLSNVINALAGLFILEVVLLEKTGCVVDDNELFSVEGHRVFRNYMVWGAR